MLFFVKKNKWSEANLHYYLVGGFNPFEKKNSQIGNLPQIGVKIKNIWVATT